MTAATLLTAPRHPAAVLWDMDGTLVDTEPYWLRAESDLVHAAGGVWTPEDGLQLVGSGLERSALILQSRGVELSVEEVIATLTDRVREQIADAVPWRPGSRELLRELKDAGIPTALVTMSRRHMALDIVAALGFDGFDVVVAGDDVQNAKPHPEPYLTAASQLGVAIEQCIALEDSEPGVASAVAAGATVFALPLHIPLPPSPAYLLRDQVPTLADLTAVLA
ncbi:HAD family hydrolase [Pseudolysinimonas yzui]|uniref:Haloacid dehalogenase n=1 Tax=Pseudolysinimonas yzui TaxID=2708254 RepID=A0A8J3GP76_9MICO|nr:HAD family phosphatase [Pseudolysinimonas yzui]GHF09717.1 haloacid dehalogenase [Pseudolysinimonas yzui]